MNNEEVDVLQAYPVNTPEGASLRFYRDNTLASKISAERKVTVFRLLKDKAACRFMQVLTVCSGLIVFAMLFGLYLKSRPILACTPLSKLIFSSAWHPLKGEFGFFPFIMGTLWVTGLAVIIAVPLCLLTAIFVSEYCNTRIKDLTKPIIDLLSAIPSVIYGVWGVLVIVPLIKGYIAPFFRLYSTGYCILAGGIVLAIMISPVIIGVCVEVFSSVSQELRDASLALGATKWQTVKFVLIKKALPGIIAAVVLGIARAFGETMAILMVAGNVARVPHTVTDPGYPLPALIANNYGEMLSIPLYDSALMFASLILLFIVILFNIGAKVVFTKAVRMAQ